MAYFDIPRFRERAINLDKALELPLESLSTPTGPRALSPPPEERLKRAKEARKLQLLHYQQREQERSQQHELPRRSPKKVSFHVRERLRDAVMRSDQGEGEKAAEVMHVSSLSYGCG